MAYLQDEDAGKQQGMILFGIFFVTMLLSIVCKNQFFFYKLTVSVQVRKVLVAALFDKITKLSMKSMSKTNAGKLITLISSDLFNIEKAMSFIPVLLSVPLLNLISFAVIYFNFGWESALIIACVWLMMILCQLLVSIQIKKVFTKMGGIND